MSVFSRNKIMAGLFELVPHKLTMCNKSAKSGAETMCIFQKSKNDGFHRKKPTPDENKSCEWGSQNQHKTVFRSIWERFHGSKFLRFPIANHPPSQSHSPPQLPPTADHQRSHFLIQSKFLPQWPALQTSPLFIALVRLNDGQSLSFNNEVVRQTGLTD